MQVISRCEVIARRENEGVVIGDEISVTVLDIYEDHVRLAISAPNNFPSYWEQTLYWEPAEVAHEFQMN